MTGEDLRALQKTMVDAMAVVDKICRDNNIKYYMVKGTLLGAVRHKGFIPWDLDSDFAMFRDDYEKFLTFASILDTSEFKLQHVGADENCDITFARLLVNKVKIRKSSDTTRNLHLDIFVLDYLESENRITELIKEKIVLFLGYVQSYRVNRWSIKGKNSWWKNLLIRIGAYITRNFNGENFDKLTRKIAGCKYYKTDYAAILNSRYGYSKEKYKCVDFSNTIELEFEGHKFYAPAGYHEILNKTYGNYMKLPPKDKRYPIYFESAEVLLEQ